jgi:hypothetical protein
VIAIPPISEAMDEKHSCLAHDAGRQVGRTLSRDTDRKSILSAFFGDGLEVIKRHGEQIIPD